MEMETFQSNMNTSTCLIASNQRGDKFVQLEEYSDLMEAAFNGDLATVQCLLKQGCDVKLVNKDGSDACMMASYSGQEKIVELLLKSGCDCNNTSNDGYNALIFACQNGHCKVAEILIQSEADVNRETSDGYSALVLASVNGHENIVELLQLNGADLNYVGRCGSNALMGASSEGHKRIVEFLLQCDVDVNLINKDGWNALMIASQNGHEHLIELLLNRGANLNKVNVDGFDALMIASQNGHFGIVELLLKSGANVKNVSDKGNDALMIASQNGHCKIVDLLINKGADIHRINIEGCDALMNASFYGHFDTVQLLLKCGSDFNRENTKSDTALGMACVNGHDSIVRLLIEHKSNVNHANRQGDTGLIMASVNGHEKTVQILLENEADAKWTNTEGWDALKAASQNGHVNVVELLLNHGADLTRACADQREALMIATENRHEKVVRLLLKSGADVTRSNTEGWNALMIACENGDQRIAELLLNSGANVNHTSNDGSNALMSACDKGHYQIVDLLLQYGANSKQVNADGWDALKIASFGGNVKIVRSLLQTEVDLQTVNKFGWDSLMTAFQNPNEEILELLIEAGADFNVVYSDGNDALMTAIENGLYRIVKLLLMRGADINRVNPFGWDALMISIPDGHIDIFDLLLKHGAQPNRVGTDGLDSLMIASKNGQTKIVKRLLKMGKDLRRVDNYGWNALIIASEDGHFKVVKLLVENGADVGEVNTDGWDALVISSQKGHEDIVELLLLKMLDLGLVDQGGAGHFKDSDTLTCSKNIPENKIALASLIVVMESIFVAFENRHIDTVVRISNMLREQLGNVPAIKEICYICQLCQTTRSDFDLEKTIKDLNEWQGDDQTKAYFQMISRTISHHIHVTLQLNDDQIPESDQLLESSAQVLREYSTLKDFEPCQFYLYQKTLRNIFYVMEENYEERLLAFFSLLLEFQYIEKTLAHMTSNNLLDTRSHSFSLPVVRDMLRLILCSSNNSPQFALRLAECNLVQIYTDYFIANRDVQSTQTNYVTSEVVMILHNIARRRGTMEYFNDNNTKLALLNYTFQDAATSLVAKLLLWLIEDDSHSQLLAIDADKTLVEYIQEAVTQADRKHNGFRLSELLQGLSRFARKDQASREIIPLFDTLKIILNQRDPEEQEFTTECLKELSSNEEASQEIISNDELTEVLNMLNDCGNSEILDNVNSIFWRSGRTSGILPTKPDKVLSDDFPKEFHIETGQRLGAGAFGSVHLVTDMQHPEENKFVAKRLNFRDEKHMETCKKEAMILLKTKHPRIVQFHGFLKQEDAFFIFLEYLKSGTLASFVSDRGHLDEKLTRHFTIQILEGVDYLHQNNILHRDIKGCNILMEDDWNIKITDFGISEINDSSGVQTDVGTVLYMAPEVIFTEGNTILYYTSRADIWSVGCTVVEMLTGRPPNSSLLPVQVAFKSMKGEPQRYQLPDTTSSLVKSFLDRIFQRDPKLRPTADWLLKNDPFIVSENEENFPEESKKLRLS